MNFGRAEADLIPWVAGIQTAGESSGSACSGLAKAPPKGPRQRVGGRTRGEEEEDRGQRSSSALGQSKNIRPE